MSTRTAEAWSRTRMASPWPTSSTTNEGFAPDPGAIAARKSSPAAMPATTLACHRDRGRGHHAHMPPAAPSATPPTAAACVSKPTAAPGSDASRDASAAIQASGTAAAPSTDAPTLGTRRPTTAPPKPATRPSVTRGTATTFAIGETSDSSPNAGSATGSVAACATSVSATGPAIILHLRPSADSAQRVASAANMTSPATAQTDSRYPRSKAT